MKTTFILRKVPFLFSSGPFSGHGALNEAKGAPNYVKGIEPGTHGLRGLFFPALYLWSSLLYRLWEEEPGKKARIGVILGLHSSQRGREVIGKFKKFK